jgi:hypothetical protein
VTPEIVDTVRSLLKAPAAVEMMTEKNFALGKQFFSYELLEQRLRQVLMNFGQV